jgi:hypothetical protein
LSWIFGTKGAGGGGGISNLIIASGFATPDILNNWGFEGASGSWGNFTNDSPPNPPSPSTPDQYGMSVNLSQDFAYQGSWSAKVTWGNNDGQDSAVQFAYDFANQAGQTIFARVYFYYSTVLPNAPFRKWIRFQQAGFSPLGGTFLTSSVNSGGVTWYDPDGCSGCTAIDIGTGTVSTGVWHYLEMCYDRSTWNQSYGNRVRFWYDGNATIGANSGSPNYGTGGLNAFWGDVNGVPNGNGPWLYTGNPGTNINIAILDFDDTFNSGMTNSSAVYYDRIAISTQRIGP